MQIFEESDLRFSFPDDWVVKKFDKTRFFKTLSGEGFKGVDFIIITPEPKLILIEVKNYSGDWLINGVSPTENLKNTIPVFSQKIIHKFHDSFHLCEIIQKVYERKWWYPRFANFIERNTSFPKIIKRDWGFWKNVNVLLGEKKVELVLSLKLSDEMQKEEQEEIRKEISELVEKRVKEYYFAIELLRSDAQSFTEF